VAVAGDTGPLRSVQEGARFYRLYLSTDPADGTEVAVATPGLDEVSLISDLIDAIRGQVMITPGLRQPVLAGFHLGMIRLTSTGFGGTGVQRVRTLIRDPSIAAHVSLRAGANDPVRCGPCLAVAITAGLFADLRVEGLPGDGWQLVSAASAWLRLFVP
jgi:hypothetical protein